MRTADDYIRMYSMQPHPEGGYYSPAYRGGHLSFGQPRDLYSSIYFLFTTDSISALHRLRSDEIWHWYDGDTILITEIDPAGELRLTQIGVIPGKFQHLIPAGNWFGGNSNGTRGFALMGCTVHPGFDFADFELGRKEELLALYPHHAQMIAALTRDMPLT